MADDSTATPQRPPVELLIRLVTTLAVGIVGAIAAIVSYSHMQELAHTNGEAWRSWLIPISIDGLIVAASMVLLTRRRNELPTSPLAWGALVFGVVTSIYANTANAESDITAQLLAASAPAVFAIAFELLLQQRRAASGEPTESPATVERIVEPLADEPARAIPAPTISAPLTRVEQAAPPTATPPSVPPAAPPRSRAPRATPIRQNRPAPGNPPSRTRVPASFSTNEERRQEVIRLLQAGHLTQAAIATRTGMSLRAVELNAAQLRQATPRPRRERQETA